MAEIQRIGDTTDILGEGPVWDVAEQALYWVDIRRPAVRRYDSATGRVASYPMPEPVGSLAVRARGGLLLALKSSLSFFDLKTGTLQKVAAPESEMTNHRFNDGKCDRQGRFWAGTMNDVTREPEGALYRLDPTRGCVKMEQDIRIPNSLCWSPDGRIMYFADSLTRTIFAYPFDPDTGAIGEKKPFATVDGPGIPDGATVDSEGFLWCAQYDAWRIARYAPDGRLVRTIDLPAQRPTSVQFGGLALDILYVTTASQRLTPEELAKQPLAGALLALDVGMTGLPEARYAG